MKNARTILRQESGFTIIEILVVVALIGVVFLGVFSLQSNIMKTNSNALNSLEVTDLKYEIAGMLAQGDKCSALLAGKLSAVGELTIADHIKAGGVFGKLKISSISLNGIRDLGNSKRAANIRLQGTKIGGSAHQSTFDESVPVFYTVNASNMVVTCKDNSSVCSSMGGVWVTDHCDFCASLGGKLTSNNKCSMN